VAYSLSASSVDAAIRYVFTWHALSDCCPKCRHLNGKEYRDQDLFQNTLWDVFWGDIWDLDADHTLVHPNCRCQLELRVDVNLNKLPSFVAFKQLIHPAVRRPSD